MGWLHTCVGWAVCVRRQQEVPGGQGGFWGRRGLWLLQLDPHADHLGAIGVELVPDCLLVEIGWSLFRTLRLGEERFCPWLLIGGQLDDLATLQVLLPVAAEVFGHHLGQGWLTRCLVHDAVCGEL